MIISGLQKMTLLDYPGKVACTIFTQGCNFRCPFCHNSGLLGSEGPDTIPEETLLAFLKKRVGLLDAVCFTGGEPTLSAGLAELIARIKELGYLVKLDTNGTRPQVVKALVEARLIDYVAMDIKNSPARYAETVGLPGTDMAPIEESIRILSSGAVDYEFRTTVADELHSEASMREMGQWLASLVPGNKVKRLFLQRFVDRDSVLFAGLSAPDEEKMAKFIECLEPFAEYIAVRG